jgi:hypothetical protein
MYLEMGAKQNKEEAQTCGEQHVGVGLCAALGGAVWRAARLH